MRPSERLRREDDCLRNAPPSQTSVVLETSLPFLLPLISALLYVIGALLVKRAAELGVGVWRSAFVSHALSLVVYLPLLLLGGQVPDWALLWQPALTALVWWSGQVLLFLSLERGDVSVATPVLGVKIILVAVFATLLLGETVATKLWIAAALSSVAIALLNRTEGVRHHHVARTILYALLSAVSYALFDVLVRKWAAAWGVGRFLPITAAFLALYSLTIIPRFKAPLRELSWPTWRWLLAGTLLIAVQSLIFVFCLAQYGQVTAANIIYSSRGLWSVVLVWLVGHWFRNQEQQLGMRILRWRLAGAVLMTAAIVLVVW